MEKDLFEHYEELPKQVQDVLTRYETGGFSYDECNQLEQELKPLGYTFDWGLSAEPFNLRKL